VHSYVTALHAQVPVTIYDPSPSVLSTALSRLDKLLERDVDKARLTKEVAQAARARISGVEGDGTSSSKGKEIRDVDLVIEVNRTAPWYMI